MEQENSVLTPNPKAPWVIIGLAVLSAVLLAGIVILGLTVANLNKQVSSLNKQIITLKQMGGETKKTEGAVDSKKTSVTTSMDSTWNLYTNNKYGFCFKKLLDKPLNIHKSLHKILLLFIKLSVS